MLHSLIQSLKIVTIALLALLVVLSGQRFFAYYTDHETSADVGQQVTFTVQKDDDASAVADRLAADHLIRSKLVFKMQLRLTNGDLQAGTYPLRRGMSVSDIIGLITGKTTASAPAAKDVKVTVIEGWRTEQFAEAAQQAGLQGGAAAFIAATKRVDASQYDFLADKPKNASLEGYLFPDTYNFTADSPDALVAYALQDFGQRFTPAMRQQAKAENLTIYQVVTLASIVEREAQDPKERPIIAGVYINRLEQGMKLQADPTVQYAVGKTGDWWPAHLTEAQLQVDNPYNTYVYPNLPPGPICNPGLASIQAVLNYDHNNYLYFVAKGDGTHAFAQTLDEQNANIAKYLGGASSTATATSGGSQTIQPAANPPATAGGSYSGNGNNGP